MPAVPLPIAALAAASYVAPTLVAPAFRRIMLRPRRHVRPPPVQAVRAADERLDLGKGLVAWRWGHGPKVLLVHGFEGSRLQFGAIIEALVGAGFSALALDAPGHGESAGDELTVVQYVEAIERALARLGPVHAVVGHSLGGAMSVFSIAEAGGANRIAAISAPSSLKRQLNRFAEAVGLSKRGRAAFIASVEARVGRPAADFDVRRVAGKVAVPMLVIHDQNDRQVPVVEAARAAHALPGAELIVTRGFGHNRLLAAPVVIRAVLDFVSAPRD